jgi:hypothetical protein
MMKKKKKKKTTLCIGVVRVIQTWDGTCCHAMNVSRRKLA